MTLAEKSHSDVAIPLALSNGPVPFGKFIRALSENPIMSYQNDDHVRDIVARRRLWKRYVIVNEPQAIKHVMIENSKNYIRTELGRRVLEPFIGYGLLASEGEAWRYHRQVIAPACDVRSTIKNAPAMAAVANDMVNGWEHLSDGTVIDIYDVMRDATLEAICQMMFSCSAGDIGPLVRKGFSHARQIGKPSLFDLLDLPIWAAKFLRPGRGQGKVNEFTTAIDILFERREKDLAQGKVFDDLLSRLLAARDNSSSERSMSALQAHDEAATIFTAGHHTTALALTWTLYMISQNAAAEARLHQEIDAVLAGRSATYDDLQNLPYTRMVIEESLRLVPPVHTLPRQAIAKDEILGTPIYPGSTVLIVPWLLHRKPSLWKDPENFQPERFDRESVKARHRFAYIPFGGGPHVCIGASISMTEAMLFLATIAQRYKLELDPNHQVEVIGLFNVMPRNGMKMRILRRSA